MDAALDTAAPVTPQSLMDDAHALGAKADAGMAALRDERGQEFKRRQGEQQTDTAAYTKATDDLASSMGEHQKVAMPNPDLGPMLDPQQTQNFAFGMIALSLVGAIGGRKHWGMATAALDGLLQGMRSGAEAQMKAKREEFDREFKLALEKQKEADRVYEDVLKSKTLSLNRVAELIRIHATAHQDWDMEAKARSKDFDGMYTRMHQNEQAAEKMGEFKQTMDMKLAELAEKRQTRLDKEKVTGNQGLSERYKTDPEYKRNVDFWAKYVAKGNSLPARFAQSGAGKAMFGDIVSAVPMIAGSPDEVRAGAVELTGQKSEARALGNRTAAIEQAASEAREMAPIVRELSAKVDRTRYPDLNAVLVAYEKKTGDVPVKQLGAALNSYINSYARAVNPTGVGTVSDKEHAREVIGTADSDAQVNGILDVLDREMSAAQHSPENVKRKLHNEITGGGDSGAGKTVNWNDLK